MTNADTTTTRRADSTPSRGAGRAWNLAAAVLAVALSAALGLAAYAKFTHPNKAKRMFESADGADYVLQDPIVAAVEVVVILALLLGHRLKIAWVGVTLMFGGFAGYALFYLLRGEPCGCFGELFTPPIWMTFVIDVVAVAAGLGMLAWRGVSLGKLAGLLVGAVALGGVGFAFADTTAPLTAEEEQRDAERAARDRQDRLDDRSPDQNRAVDGNEEQAPNADADNGGESTAPTDGSAEPAPDGDDELPGRADGFTAPERLLRSTLMSDIRAATIGPDAPAYYVFIHDPDCPTCAEKMIFVEQYAMTYLADDPVLRVADFEKLDIERATRGGDDPAIGFSAWTGSPVVFVVRQGRVTNVYENDAAPTPEEVRGDLDFGMLEPNFPED